MSETGTALRGQRIAVTGAAGGIGRALVPALLAAGAEVTALVRDPRGAAGLAKAGARLAVARLGSGDAAALERALAGAGTVIHLAYDVRAGMEENLAAFAALHAAALAAGAGHFVQASSAVVYDDWPAGGTDGSLDEAAPIGTRPARGYRSAKIEIERRLMAGALPATILQPTVVWGPGCDLWTRRPMRQLAAGGLVLPEPCGRAPLVHVEDAARAFLCAAAAGPGEGGRRLLVNGPEAPGWDALFEGYRAICGGTLPRRPLAECRARVAGAAPAGGPSRSSSGPSAAARARALARRMLGRRRMDALLDLAARLRPASGPAWPDAGLVELYAASPRIAGEAARAAIGFSPRIDLAAGLDILRKQSA